MNIAEIKLKLMKDLRRRGMNDKTLRSPMWRKKIQERAEAIASGTPWGFLPIETK